MTRPPFNIISPDVLIRFKYLLPILGISICLLELGYVFFIWMKKTGSVWLVCILGMHVAIGLTMGMYLFALVMIVLNVAAFAPDLDFVKDWRQRLAKGRNAALRRRAILLDLNRAAELPHGLGAIVHSKIFAAQP